MGNSTLLQKRKRAYLTGMAGGTIPFILKYSIIRP